MAAIPELREGWALSLTSLELYTDSEPRLLMSPDPVALDALMLDRINAARKRTGFEPVGEDEARMLDFAAQLGVGVRHQGRQLDPARAVSS
jgi:hypothetical protein